MARFANLAGRADADIRIQAELAEAGIEPVKGERSTGEVSACFTGKLGPFTFERDWRYWRVKGPMPLEQARALYTTEVGRRDVRAGGYCGCEPPDEHSTWRASDGRELLEAREHESFTKASDSGWFKRMGGWEWVNREYVFTNDRAACGAPFVECYHIDSQEGLNLFTETVRRLDVLR